MRHYVVAHYLPTSLFSLKDSKATSAGGKTLLVPSPYAVKMALLDVAARWHGVEAAKEVFSWLKALEIRPSPPQYACVTNAFIKIQTPWQSKESGEKAKEATRRAKADGKVPFQPNIGFREYAQFQGELRLAIEVATLNPQLLEMLKALLLRVNYFGKRGCFMQFTEFSELTELGAAYVTMTGDQKASSGSVMHYLDDFGSKTTWDKVNIYLSDRPDRDTNTALLPYQLKRSSKRSSLYHRVV